MFQNSWFDMIASLVNYKKRERLVRASDISIDDLMEVVKGCLLSESAIFFFPNSFIEIGVYGAKLSRFGLSQFSENTQNYLTFAPQLEEKFLRRLFTGIEFLAYKLCFIIIENQRHDYNFENEKTKTRIKKLIQGGHLSAPADMALFDDIWFVRAAFAHSFVDVEEIKFRKRMLRDCFGLTYLGQAFTARDIGEKDEFMNAVQTLLNPMVQLFIQNQAKQLDSNKFNRLCDRLLKDKSLTR